MLTSNTQLPLDQIWTWDGKFSELVLPAHSNQLQDASGVSDVRNFFHMFAACLHALSSGEIVTDKVKIARAVYTFAISWKPPSGRGNFIREAWGPAWLDTRQHFKQMQVLLRKDASLEQIRIYDGR
jgi:hypothetical protein